MSHSVSVNDVAAMPMGEGGLAFALEPVPPATPAFAARILASIQCVYALGEISS